MRTGPFAMHEVLVEESDTDVSTAAVAVVAAAAVAVAVAIIPLICSVRSMACSTNALNEHVTGWDAMQWNAM